MEFGKTLREAREAQGYSIAQLAEMTHIMSQAIEGLENEDFKKIPAPIYGRGFVKLCCQALDLEAKPMIDEFMAIYSGEKPPAKHIAIPASKPIVEEPVAPAPVIEETPAPSVPQHDLFGQPVSPQPAVSGPLPITPQPVTPLPTAPAKTVSRFAPPTSEATYTRPALEMPAIPWRLVMLIIAAIAVIWLIVAGCNSLYRSLSSEGGVSAPSQNEQKASPSNDLEKQSVAPKAQRTPKPVKPLYID